MRSSRVSYMVAGVNYGSALINFIGLIINVRDGSQFALLNMLFIFSGILLGTMLLDVGKVQESQGR